MKDGLGSGFSLKFQDFVNHVFMVSQGVSLKFLREKSWGFHLPRSGNLTSLLAPEVTPATEAGNV